MIETVNKIEKIIYAVLMGILIIVLIASLVDLLFNVYNDLLLTTPARLDPEELIPVLGGFLLVLIGVELLDTIKAYFRENTIHVEIVVLLAVIAVARKVLLLNPGNTSTFEFDLELIGIGILIAGLGAGYYLIKKAGITIGPGEKPRE
jgi:uncharacterized membrane protein (DUF373 family)